MKKLKRCLLGIACFSAMTSTATAFHGVDVDLTCPTQASDGATVTVDMLFKNRSCSAVNVRVVSSIVGNTVGTLAGIGVFGPVVAMPVVVVPAGTDVYGGCVGGICEDYGDACLVNSDCEYCYADTPGTKGPVPIEAGPPLPSQLIGTVAALILISEAQQDVEDGETETEVNECLVEVID